MSARREPASARRALVVGGSVGGLLAAHLLRGAGWEVTVFERATEDLAGRGAGIGTRPELFAVLRRIGIRLDESMGVVHVGSRKYLHPDGTLALELPLPSINSAWDRIYRPLRDALPAASLRAGTALERVVRNEPGLDAGVEAVFADGSVERADLLVGADGLHSTVRRECMPEACPSYAGYLAWRGVLDEAQLPVRVHAELFHHMSFSVAGNELILCMPMPGRNDETREGLRRFHFIWFRPAGYDTELRELCTDATGRKHGVSIPPPLIRPEVIAALRSDARAILPPQMAAMVEFARQPLLQPIYDLVSPRVAAGRVALVGDAAFVARPHVATGITKAALDAQCLVDCLQAAGDDIDAGLAAYDRQRQPFGASLVARARLLGSYLEPGPRSPQDVKLAEHYRRPEVILAQYGAAGSIHDAQTRADSERN
jgi:2-polyprenyl-6-methoxyphenol hydroxylase-like FAD-dependent oxidoreductase